MVSKILAVSDLIVRERFMNSFCAGILKFLRLAPFDKMFKQLVTLPAKREPEIVLGRMRLVFNSITLRRTKDKLSLPQNIKILQKVELRDDERALYKRFTEEIQRGIRNIATEELSRKYSKLTLSYHLDRC